MSFTLSLSEFFYFASQHYYNQSIVFGTKGDFTTSPEISPLFGAILAHVIIHHWQANQPTDFTLMEWGGGRGVMMADILQQIQQINQKFPETKNLLKSLKIFMLESSNKLIKEQKFRLKNLSTHCDSWKKKSIDEKFQWFDQLNHLPDQSCDIIIANEFFDALPCDQYRYHKKNNTWQKTYVVINCSKSISNFQELLFNQSLLNLADFNFIYRPCSLPKELEDFFYQQYLKPKWQTDDICEYHPAFSYYIKQLARLLKSGGMAVLIDYGYEGIRTDSSLQCLYRHQPVRLFQHIGQADLTTHVNFDYLWYLAKQENLQFYYYGQQADFLKNLGIKILAQNVTKNCSAKKSKEIWQGVNRLIDQSGPASMGQLFRVLQLKKP